VLSTQKTDICNHAGVHDKRKFQVISDFYRFFSSLLQLPTNALISSLHDSSFEKGFRQMVDEMGFRSNKVEVSEALYCLKSLGQKNETNLQVLRHAYTTLFTHPDKPLIFIYESQFLFWEAHPDAGLDEAPRLFVNPAALDAERCYKKAGLSRSVDFNESADHMSIELEFMARLYAYRVELFEKGDTEELIRVDDLIAEFNSLHFKKWGIAFFQKCAQTSVHPFYQALGSIGAVFMEEMLERI
jgi:TorA maturation chaperone TorD